MQRYVAALIIVIMLWSEWVFAQTVFMVVGDEHIPVIACIEGVRMSIYHQHIKEITYSDGETEIPSVLVPESMGAVWVSTHCFGEQQLGNDVRAKVVFDDGTIKDLIFEVDADLLVGYKKIPFVKQMGNSRQTFTLRPVNNRIYAYSLTRPPTTDEFEEFNKRPDIPAPTTPKGKIVPLAPFQEGAGK